MGRLSYKPLLMAFGVVLAPQVAVGLAGLAERSTSHHYNSYAILLWEHPSDLCRVGKYCFRLYDKEENRPFDGFDHTLTQITVPRNRGDAIVLAQLEEYEEWVLYDLSSEKYVLEAEDFQSAREKWKSYGLGEPLLADSKSIDKHFRETISSRFTRFSLSLWWLLPLMAVVSAAPFLTYTTFILFRNFWTKRGTLHLLFGILCLFPTISLWLMILVGVWYSFVSS